MWGYYEAKTSKYTGPEATGVTGTGIATKDKTTEYVGLRGDWTRGYGYITRDGFCPCGATLAAYEDERCPGAQKDPRAADEHLLK
ncbi:hypothetical protein BGZ97_003903, partial [Linnemannia gamsii]